MSEILRVPIVHTILCYTFERSLSGTWRYVVKEVTWQKLWGSLASTTNETETETAVQQLITKVKWRLGGTWRKIRRSFSALICLFSPWIVRPSAARAILTRGSVGIKCRLPWPCETLGCSKSSIYRCWIISQTFTSNSFQRNGLKRCVTDTWRKIPFKQKLNFSIFGKSISKSCFRGKPTRIWRMSILITGLYQSSEVGAVLWKHPALHYMVRTSIMYSA